VTKIKICGLRRDEDIEYVNMARPDYAGFVFAPGRRQVTAEFARELRQRLRDGITPVGVFVGESAENILRAANVARLEVVQLHGDEDEECVGRLRREGMTVIKAVRMPSEVPETAADYLLFDNALAGSGESFDWAQLEPPSKPFFLAGGINIGNVRDAIGMLKPYAVDVSSGVETDGVKDKDKISEIVRCVKNG
jgi:phosphoribosylanthranilate isomerase